jgi:hypothetical protein
MPLTIAQPELVARLEKSLSDAASPRPEPPLPDIGSLRKVLADAKEACEAAELEPRAAQAAVARSVTLLESEEGEVHRIRSFNEQVAAKRRAEIAAWAASGGHGAAPPHGPQMSTQQREEALRAAIERRDSVAGALVDLKRAAATAEASPKLAAVRAAHALAAGAVLAAYAEHRVFEPGGLRDRERQDANDRIWTMTVVAVLTQGAGQFLPSARLRKYADDRAPNCYVSGDDPRRKAEVAALLERLKEDPAAELGA